MLASRQVTLKHAAVPEDCVITLSAAGMSKTFKQVNIHKAAGPDGLSGRVLRVCADQLTTCFKQTTIVPVPKNTKVTRLNDYRPVELMSVAMKCFERLVIAHINTIIPDTLDPLQSAYALTRKLQGT